MKRFAVATALLVLIGVSVAMAQRSKDEATGESATEKSIFAELSIGQAIVWLNPQYSGISFTLLTLPKGETPADYRERLKQDEQKTKDEIKAAKAAIKEHWASRPEAPNDEEVDDATAKKLKAWSTRYIDLTKKVDSLQSKRRPVKPDEVFEVTHIFTDYMKLSDGKNTSYCIPFNSVNYFKINEQPE